MPAKFARCPKTMSSGCHFIRREIGANVFGRTETQVTVRISAHCEMVIVELLTMLRFFLGMKGITYGNV